MNPTDNIKDKGIVGNLIDFIMTLLFGENPKLNAISIGAAVLGVALVGVGFYLLVLALIDFLRGKRDESKKHAIAGLSFFAIGAVVLTLISVYYNAVVNRYGGQ